MTAREMMDSLSGTLLCDERILSVPERELLANLLQRTRNQASIPQNAVATAITRTVGEIIAERAPGSSGGKLYPTATPAAVNDVLEFSKPKSAGDSLLVSNASAKPFARTEPTPPARHHSPAHQRGITADNTAQPFARTEPTPPTRHKSAAHHTRDYNLATEDRRSRRPGGRGLRVGPMCGSGRVPDLG
jgi:hypothetical protein